MQLLVPPSKDHQAIVLMYELETKFSQSQSLQPLAATWFRNISAIFHLDSWQSQTLQDDLNSSCNIKFTHESRNNKNVTFFNVIVKLSKGRLNTDLHIKDTHRHQCLHFNCLYSDHTKRTIIYSQALRLTKLYTFEIDFLRHRNEMKS